MRAMCRQRRYANVDRSRGSRRTASLISGERSGTPASRGPARSTARSPRASNFSYSGSSSERIYSISSGVGRELSVRQPSRSNTSLAGITSELAIDATVTVDMVPHPPSILRGLYLLLIHYSTALGAPRNAAIQTRPVERPLKAGDIQSMIPSVIPRAKEPTYASLGCRDGAAGRDFPGTGRVFFI